MGKWSRWEEGRKKQGAQRLEDILGSRLCARGLINRRREKGGYELPEIGEFNVLPLNCGLSRWNKGCCSFSLCSASPWRLRTEVSVGMEKEIQISDNQEIQMATVFRVQCARQSSYLVRVWSYPYTGNHIGSTKCNRKGMGW